MANLPISGLSAGSAVAIRMDNPVRIRARRIPAGAQSRLRTRRQGAGRQRHPDHVPSRPAQRRGRHHDLHAVHHVVLGGGARLARFPRLRPATGLTLAWRIAAARKVEFAGAMAWPCRLCWPEYVSNVLYPVLPAGHHLEKDGPAFKRCVLKNRTIQD